MILTAETDIKIIDLLLQVFPESNKTRIRKFIRLGCVSYNGVLINHPEFLVHSGQSVDFKRYQVRDNFKEEAPFKILHEDEDLLVVFKPAGVLSSGRTTEKIRSMFGMVNKYVTNKTRDRQRAYTVHRLDREVCGLLMFAKSEEAKFFMQDHWKDVEKRYYAVVEGFPQKKSGTITSFLKENSQQVVYSVDREEEGAKWAVTHYKMLEYNEIAQRSLLEVQLETGRKNQIRVHLSDLGCPIVGDRKYGADASEKRPIHLMAFYLSFPLFSQDKRETVEIPLIKGFWS